MKDNIKIFLIFTLLFVSKSFAQVVTSITDVLVNSQTTVNNCGLIDFGSTSNNNLTVHFKLTKPSSQAVGNCTLKILLKYSSSSTGSERANIIVQSGSWANNTEFIGNILCNISESEIQVTGSSIYIECTTDSGVKTKSCEYPLKKTPTPTFTLTPAEVSIGCNSTSPVTFTVNNLYNSPGTLTYNWSVTGWLKDGVPAGSFTTTTNTVTLVPSSYPPSSVYVWPVLNGVTQTQRYSAVSLAPFTSLASISGNNSLCTNATYSITGLQAGQTVVWSLSDTTIATLNNTTNTQTTLTRVGDGQVTLVATITNSCGQTIQKTKTIYLGLPSLPTKLTGPSSVTSGALVNYQSGGSIGATSYEWWLPFPYETVNAFDYFGQNWQKLTDASSSSSIRVFTGYAGNSGLIQVMGKNECGCGGVKTMSVSHGSSGGAIPRMANPAKNNKYKIYPNPSDDMVFVDLKEGDNNRQKATIITGELFDILGYSKGKVQIIDDKAVINVGGLPKGIYILKISIDSETESHQIVVQ